MQAAELDNAKTIAQYNYKAIFAAICFREFLSRKNNSLEKINWFTVF